MGLKNYKFNLQTGHYERILFEGEQVTDGTVKAEQSDSKNQGEQPANNILKPFANTPEIIQMQKDMSTKVDNISKEIQKKHDIKIQIDNKIAQYTDEKNSKNATQSGLNQLQAQLLQAQLDIAKKEFDKAKIIYDESSKILAAQKKLIESKITPAVLPAKYMGLNESNIQNAKIYIDRLIDNDVQQRIKGMVDFKKAFSTAQMLYGKDKKGYYAVCIDQDDFNKLTNTLEEVGYLRDDIISTVMPQLFNRTDMV